MGVSTDAAYFYGNVVVPRRSFVISWGSIRWNESRDLGRITPAGKDEWQKTMKKKKAGGGRFSRITNRSGKRFVPPLIELGMTEVSFVNQLLPEILWMGLINDKLGYKRGIETALLVAKTANAISNSVTDGNFALASSYLGLSKDQQKEVIRKLDASGELTTVRFCLKPLVVLYKGFPLSFLGASKEKRTKRELIKTMAGCVARHMNKYHKPATAIQTAVIYIRGVAGKLVLPAGFDIDLNAIFESPEFKQGQIASSFVRACVMTEVLIPEAGQENMWARSFWNQGIKLGACDVGRSHGKSAE